MTKASPWWDCNAWKLGYCSWIQNLFCSMVLWVWRALAVTRYRAFVATSPDCSTSERNSKTARTSTTARVTWIKMNHESNIRNLHTDNDIFGFWWFFHPWKIKHPCNFTNNGKANLPTKNSLETWPFPFGKKKGFFPKSNKRPRQTKRPPRVVWKKSTVVFHFISKCQDMEKSKPLKTRWPSPWSLAASHDLEPEKMSCLSWSFAPWPCPRKNTTREFPRISLQFL